MPLSRTPRPHGRQPARVSPYRRAAHFVWAWGLPSLILFFALTRVATWETERWWFQSMDQAGVYSRLFVWRCGSFLAVAVLYAAILGWNARTAWRISSHTSAPIGWGELWEAEGGSRLIPLEDKLGLDRYRRMATVIVIALIACLAGSAAASHFNVWIEAFYGAPTGIQDSFWQRDISFALFHLPALHAANAFVFWALLISLSLSATIYIYEEAIELGGRRAYISPEAMRHLATLLAAMVALKSISWRLDAWDIQSAASLTGTIQPGFFGYAAAHYRLPALTTASWLAVPVAATMLYLAHIRRGRVLLALGLGFPLAAWLAAALLPMWALANQNDDGQLLETGYRDRHIEATESSWGLEHLEDRALPTAGKPANAVEDKLVMGLPVWPPGAVRTELSNQWRNLKVKSNLQITAIHLEQWLVNGQPRPVYVCAVQAPGTLMPLPDDTPGLAIVDAQKRDASRALIIYQAPLLKEPEVSLSPVLAPGLSSQGATHTTEFGLWPRPLRPDIDTGPNSGAMERPFGDPTDTMLTAGLDWTTETPQEHSVSTRSLWARLLLAWRFMDPDLVKNTTPVQWHRQVVQRCEQLAPFLHWDDADPRPVLAGGGRLVWLLDAFATSRRYPNAASPNLAGTSFTEANYARHIVTATVDAATGETHFYLLDSHEPFAALYNRAFPGLFHPLDEMPAELRAQWRPSEALFAARAAVWARIQSLKQRQNWRPAFGSSDGQEFDTVYRTWAPKEIVPYLPAGALQVAAFQQLGGSSDSATSVPITGIIVGADTPLQNAASTFPPLHPWLPAAPIQIQSDFTGDNIAVVLKKNGRTESTISLTAAIPLGSGVGVAGATAKDKTQTNKPNFMSLGVIRAVFNNEGERDIDSGILDVPPSGTLAGSLAAQQLRQAREAYRDFNDARRRRDWKAMDASSRRLEKLLLSGQTATIP